MCPSFDGPSSCVAHGLGSSKALRESRPLSKPSDSLTSFLIDYLVVRCQIGPWKYNIILIGIHYCHLISMNVPPRKE